MITCPTVARPSPIFIEASGFNAKDWRWALLEHCAGEALQPKPIADGRRCVLSHGSALCHCRPSTAGNIDFIVLKPQRITTSFVASLGKMCSAPVGRRSLNLPPQARTAAAPPLHTCSKWCNGSCLSDRLPVGGIAERRRLPPAQSVQLGDVRPPCCSLGEKAF